MALKRGALPPLGWETKGSCVLPGTANRDGKGIRDGTCKGAGGEILNPAPCSPCRARGSAQPRDRHVEIRNPFGFLFF